MDRQQTPSSWTHPDAIVVPGFVDCHLHGWEGQLRGSAPIIDFEGCLRLTVFGYGPLYTRTTTTSVRWPPR